mmetsp:Transcript_144111/g.460684  ORF Transcript_144111/g.460684 Transcript_144111/m.460684 type:complete len:82 (-) Transcript_144111:35-280(-)
MLLLDQEAEFFKTRSATVSISAQDRVGMPVFSSYGVPAPVGGPYGTMVPPEVAYVSHGNPYAAYSAYAAYARTNEQPELMS